MGNLCCLNNNKEEWGKNSNKDNKDTKEEKSTTKDTKENEDNEEKSTTKDTKDTKENEDNEEKSTNKDNEEEEKNLDQILIEYNIKNNIRTEVRKNMFSIIRKNCIYKLKTIKL